MFNVPRNIVGDPVVHRKETRVVQQLSEPSPLHSKPESSFAQMLRAAGRDPAHDDDNDDIPFADLLRANTTAAVPKFPFLRAAVVSRYTEKPTTYAVNTAMSSGTAIDPAELTRSVWNTMWWSNAGHKRVVCNLRDVKVDLAQAAPVPSRGQTIIRVPVSATIVSCEVEAPGLVVGTVVRVLVPPPREGDESSLGEGAQVVDDGTPAGLIVRLPSGQVGFGASMSAAEEARAEVFVRCTPTEAGRAPKKGSRVLLVVDREAVTVSLSGPPRPAQLGEWTVDHGAAPSATDETTGTPSSATKKARRSRVRSGSTLYDVELTYRVTGPPKKPSSGGESGKSASPVGKKKPPQ